MFIAMYDDKDNLITIFENRQECAKYFNTTKKCIDSFFSKVTSGIRENRKLDKSNGKYYKLYQYKKEEVK